MTPITIPTPQDYDRAPLVSDAELQHWGEVYRSNAFIGQAGVLFETFLRDPQAVLSALLWPHVIEQTERLQAALESCTEQAQACCAEVCALVQELADTQRGTPQDARDLLRGDRRVEQLLREVDRLPELHGCNGALVQPIHSPTINRRPGKRHNPKTLEASR